MILGMHCSVRAGHDAALAEARALGIPAMQIFSYPRRELPTEERLAAFAAAWRASHVERLIVHVRYLPFLASPDPARHAHSVALARRELRWAAALGAEGLVFHAGAFAPGEDVKRGLARFAEGLLKAADGPRVPMLFENVPGGGRRMGGPLEDLAELAGLLERRGLETGFCLDTAHAWAQGYDLSTAEGMWKFLGKAHRVLGAEKVKVFHLNDSRALLGSHREHHWHWGDGFIGLEALKHLLGRPEYAHAVGILETPKGERDAENLAKVRALA